MAKSTPSNPSVAKRATNKIKSAPQKIMEHAVDKAIKTVEKAAEKQARHPEKVMTKKIKKAIKKAERKVNASTSKATIAKRTANKIKTKIKEILAPEKEETFFYSQKSLVLLTFVYAFVAFFVWVIANCLYERGCLDNNYFLFILLCCTMFLTLTALGAAVFVMIFPPKVAVITSKSIKIDHNAPLLWKDVKLAEEKFTSSVSDRRIIALHLVDEADYPLTFMQKLCKYNVFTPFSLPLYAMDKKDVERVRHLVKKHCRYKNVCF